MSPTFGVENLSGVTGIENKPSNVPEQFILNQNYPNPFNASTSIVFSLPTANKVRLQLFNILGQEVATFVNDHLSAGIHTFQWKADNMSTGVYYYTLITGSCYKTKKMLLLK